MCLLAELVNDLVQPSIIKGYVAVAVLDTGVLGVDRVGVPVLPFGSLLVHARGGCLAKAVNQA